jgi:hypothetical protein
MFRPFKAYSIYVAVSERDSRTAQPTKVEKE